MLFKADMLAEVCVDRLQCCCIKHHSHIVELYMRVIPKRGHPCVVQKMLFQGYMMAGIENGALQTLNVVHEVKSEVGLSVHNTN